MLTKCNAKSDVARRIADLLLVGTAQFTVIGLVRGEMS